MASANRMTEDSFEKARAAFFGTAISTPLESESPLERTKTPKDTSPEDARPKAVSLAT